MPPVHCDEAWKQTREGCSFSFVRQQAPRSRLEMALGQHRRPSDVHCDSLAFVLLGPDGRLVETIHKKCEMLSLHPQALYWKGDGRHHTVLLGGSLTPRALHPQELGSRLELSGCEDGVPSWEYSEEPMGPVGPEAESVSRWLRANGVRSLFLLQRLRRYVKAIGRLVCLLRRATERCYVPGGQGFKRCRDEFEGLAERLAEPP